MEPEEPITPSSGPTTQVSSSNGATASAGSQVKWKKEVLSDIEVEAENGKRPTQGSFYNGITLHLYSKNLGFG